MDIPIIVICYNNYKYVRNTLSQILKINKEYYKNIQILNNNSSCLDTKKFLESVDVKVINNPDNNGPWVNDKQNKHIYDTLPNKFILTDPDLKLNENIPTNFIDILSELSDKYGASKIGFALDISDHEKFYKHPDYFGNYSIYNWEKHFWNQKIDDVNYELYKQDIDTTFCLINKNIYEKFNIRVAGNFTAKHLPWYIENEIYNVYENYISCINTVTKISGTSKTILSYIVNAYLKCYKKNELFLIEKKENDTNLFFWEHIYSSWENKTFDILDEYLSQDKVFIDIGGWIGATSIYASRKSKHVYTIESDNTAFCYMEKILKTNCTNNYTLINKIILNDDKNSKIIDSVPQISNNETNTITIENIINSYKIDTSEISLIKVNIKGGEENILNDLFDIHVKYNIPLYIKFYYGLWKNKNIDRFMFLSEDIKNTINYQSDLFILF